MLQGVVNQDTLDHLPDIVARFAHANPFRHVVIENFLDPAYCDRLLDEFPSFDKDLARDENGNIGRKAVRQKIWEIGPTYKALDDVVKSQDFLKLVSTITGIPDLLYDPDYFGGGTHENLEGQELDPHVDFTHHPKLKAHRRLNLIVYLNPEWDESWGGNIQMHANPRLEPGEDSIVTVAPILNRAVIFETHNTSWHGFERIRLPADKRDLSRKSIALYFYTKEREEAVKPHSTIYVERHLPSRFQPGHVLSADDLQEIRILLKRRDMHLERLYTNITNLMIQVDHLKAQVTPLLALSDSAKRQDEMQRYYEQQERDTLLRRVLELENSTSWRITAPLRFIVTAFRRLRWKLFGKH